VQQDLVFDDYDVNLHKIMSQKNVPNHIADLINQFNGELCYNKILMSLFDNKYIKKSHHLNNDPIDYIDLIGILMNCTKITITVINGNEAYVIRPRGRIQLDLNIFLLISEENITYPQQHIAISYSELSAKIHGPPKHYNKVVEYFRSMELLLNHFNHTGEMKSMFVPDKANLNRTQYEVLMILLKLESQKYLDKPIYWKIDPKRLTRVAKIQKELLNERESIKAVSTIRLPDVKKENFWNYIEVDYNVVNDDNVKEAINDRRWEELKKMMAEDFNVDGDLNKMKNKFTQLVIRDVMPPPVVLDLFGGSTTEEEIEAYEKSLIPIKTKFLIPNENFRVYIDQTPLKEIPEPILKKHKKTIKNPSAIKKEDLFKNKQEQWQEAANIEMSKVLTSSLQLTKSLQILRKEDRNSYTQHFTDRKLEYKMRHL
jgi:hypothetical protein